MRGEHGEDDSISDSDCTERGLRGRCGVPTRADWLQNAGFIGVGRADCVAVPSRQINLDDSADGDCDRLTLRSVRKDNPGRCATRGREQCWWWLRNRFGGRAVHTYAWRCRVDATAELSAPTTDRCRGHQQEAHDVGRDPMPRLTGLRECSGRDCQGTVSDLLRRIRRSTLADHAAWTLCGVGTFHPIPAHWRPWRRAYDCVAHFGRMLDCRHG